jgi:hypothetical protein
MKKGDTQRTPKNFEEEKETGSPWWNSTPYDESRWCEIFLLLMSKELSKLYHLKIARTRSQVKLSLIVKPLSPVCKTGFHKGFRCCEKPYQGSQMCLQLHQPREEKKRVKTLSSTQKAASGNAVRLRYLLLALSQL